MKKGIISLLIAGTMLCGQNSLAAEPVTDGTIREVVQSVEFAEEAPDFSKESECLETGNINLSVVDSGSCGESAKWTIFDDGTLLIDGSGDMDDYNDEISSPWILADDKNEVTIEKVIVSDGITKIGTNAFNGLGLKGIEIPESVNTIGNHAFSNCLSLEYIQVANNNKYYTSVDGILFNKAKTILLKCPVVKNGVYTVPDGVVEICEGAFSYCRNLTGINISKSVTKIGAMAFEGCEFLEKAYIPSSVAFIGDDAFDICDNLTIETVAGSVAESYAKKHNISVIVRSDAKWIKSGNRWWYRHTDGTYTKNGWELISGKWYHFDKDGWMQTGWIKSGSKWYYLSSSGAMVIGWQKVSGTWYYFNTSGAMVTGWQKVGNVWYYFNSFGAMAANKWIGNYYLTSSGAMAVNRIVGKYYVGEDGAWVNDSIVDKAVSFVNAHSNASDSAKKRLDACYSYLFGKGYHYERILGVPTKKEVPGRADYYFTNNKGNCYCFATAMAYIAKVLGYETKVTYGQIASTQGGMTNHGWCNIKINGTWYIYDYFAYMKTDAEYPRAHNAKDGVYSLSAKAGKISWH